MELNDSKIYKKWLQIELPEEMEPSYYAILGLKIGETDPQKISAALEHTLDRLHTLDGRMDDSFKTRAEMGEIFHWILDARKILLSPDLKKSYDAQLLSGEGMRVWTYYERPTFLMRVRQFVLISIGFALGWVIMMMMALMVQRNPDGSIAFHQEVTVSKPKPFTLPLAEVIYRPILAEDFRPDGYKSALAASNKPKKEKKVFNLTNEEPLEVASDVEDLPDAMDTTDADAAVRSEKTSNEVFSLLPEETSDSLVTNEDDLNESTENADTAENVESIAKPRVRSNPLYGRFQKNQSTETTAAASAENVADPVLNPASDSATNLVSEPTAAASTETEASDLPLSNNVQNQTATAEQTPTLPKSMMDVLENIRQNTDLTNSVEKEAFVLLQYNTCSSICKTAIETPESFDRTMMTQFVEYSLDVCTDLAWKKRFEEAESLNGLLVQLGTTEKTNEKSDEEIQNLISARKETVLRYQKSYENAQQAFEMLKTKPEDPTLNTICAMWLWRENGNLDPAMPYLAKCKYPILSKAAEIELKMEEGTLLEKSENLLKLADYWWVVASKVSDAGLNPLIKQHACEFYEKVDQKLLNEEQQLRVAGLNNSAMK